MPIILDWYDKEQSIILGQFIKEWSLEEFRNINAELNEMLSKVSERFDVIADFTQTTYTLPVGLLYEWEAIATYRDTRFSDWGLTMLIFGSPVHQAYFEAGFESSKAIRNHTRFVDNRVDAVDAIMRDRNQ